MASLRGILFRFAYQLQSHRWNGWRLTYWLTFALVLVAGLASLDVVRGGNGVVIGAAVALMLLWGLVLWASRSRYVSFSSYRLSSSSRSSGSIRGSADEVRANPGLAAPLHPSDRIEVRATGSFEVEGKKNHFSDLQAYFRTFATREHAVMAIVPPSRFLLLGTRPRKEVGMWYIFIRPQQILEMEPGKLRFGLRERAALSVVYQEEGDRKTVYLSFDDHSQRQRVWANLESDAAGLRQAEATAP
jgi:hypothetical protein